MNFNHFNFIKRQITTNTKLIKPKQITKLRYANNPSELIIRVKQLANDQQKLELIIQLIKSSSIRVATISVWTELFKLLIINHQQNLAYKLYLDIKRRQIQPDHIFYHQFFHLISTNPQPSQKHFNLQRLQSIYQQSLNTTINTINPQQEKIKLTNHYLNSLIQYGYQDQAIQTFNSLLTNNSFDSTTLYQISKSLSPNKQDHLHLARSLIDTLNKSSYPIDLRLTLSLATLFLKSTDPIQQRYATDLVQQRLGIELENNPYKFWTKTQPIIRPPTSSENDHSIQQQQQQEQEQQIRFEPGQLTTLLRMLLKMNKFALVRRLWTQITANPDLYLHRDALDSTHCGLVMVAMGRCQAMSEVQDLLRWMIESGNKRLRPTGDTLDKAIQAAWQTEDVDAGISILAGLTQTYTGLVDPQEKAKNSLLELIERKKALVPLKPSNRALATLLQAAGRLGKTVEIGRTLQVVAIFRTLPDRSSDNAPKPNPSLGALESSEKIERYWADQFLWVLTDLLDKLLARTDRSKVFSDTQIATFEKWRSEIDLSLQSDQDPLAPALRSRIEVRAQERADRRNLIAASRRPSSSFSSRDLSFRPAGSPHRRRT